MFDYFLQLILIVETTHEFEEKFHCEKVNYRINKYKNNPEQSKLTQGCALYDDKTDTSKSLSVAKLNIDRDVATQSSTKD